MAIADELALLKSTKASIKEISGAKPVTIQLDPAVKALLTADEIAQITSKGYTIA